MPDGQKYEQLVQNWRQLATEDGTAFDKTLELDAAKMAPQVSWGTNPGMVVGVDEKVPSPKDYSDPNLQKATQSALDYMALEAGTKIKDIKLDRIFIGSCTNSRINDLIAAARIVKDKKMAPTLSAMVVPGSQVVKLQAEKLGLDKIFIDSGFEWREAGCSMCLGMNPDILEPGERCASTSNRNFAGRQGKGGRTHLVSPIMAAAAALEGHFVDVREIELDREL